LLQRGESRGDRFIECLRSDLYGVLNVSKILYRNCARSKNHVQKRSIFAFCSPLGPERGPRPQVNSERSRHGTSRILVLEDDTMATIDPRLIELVDTLVAAGADWLA